MSFLWRSLFRSQSQKTDLPLDVASSSGPSFGELSVKFARALQQVYSLYQTKPEGTVTVPVLLDTLKGTDITVSDVKWAVNLLRAARKSIDPEKPASTVEQILNERGDGASKLDDKKLAEQILRSMAEIAVGRAPPANEMASRFGLRDPTAIARFKKAYEQRVAQDQKLRAKAGQPSPPYIDFWTRFWYVVGRYVFLYTGMLLVTFILLRKLWEAFLNVTDNIRKKISNFIRPSNNRSEFWWGFRPKNRKRNRTFEQSDNEDEDNSDDNNSNSDQTWDGDEQKDTSTLRTLQNFVKRAAAKMVRRKKQEKRKDGDDDEDQSESREEQERKLRAFRLASTKKRADDAQIRPLASPGQYAPVVSPANRVAIARPPQFAPRGMLTPSAPSPSALSPST